jgi:hypothetical protein
MTHRFLAILLAGVLALAALDGFERRRGQSENAASPTPSMTDDSGEVVAMDGGNGYPPPPPPKKAF